MDSRRGARKVAWCVASRFSSARGPQAREEVVLRDRVRNISGRANSAVAHIPPVPRVRDTRRVRGWARPRQVRHRPEAASLQGVQRPAAQASHIFRVIKKAR